MNKLHMIANGVWLDPAHIQSVVIHPDNETVEVQAGAQVLTFRPRGEDPSENPREWAEKVVALVNEARGGE